MQVNLKTIIMLLSLLPIPLNAADDDVDSILAALKQSILNESMQNGISMVSSGYVDSSGRLMESTYFSSAVDVNGIRVLEYLSEKDRQKKVADISTLPPALQTLASGNCLRPYPMMKRNAVVSINQNTRNMPLIHNLIKKNVYSALENNWVLSDDTQRSYGNHYENAYLGIVRTQNTDFHIEITLNELDKAKFVPGIKAKLTGLKQQVKIGFNNILQVNPLMEISPVAVADDIALEIVFTLIDLVQPANNKEEKFYLLLDRDGSRLVMDNNLRKFEDGLRARLYSWRKKILSEDPCVLQFAYVHAGEAPQALALNMGSVNGLQAGKRFLLLGKDIIKDGILNADWSKNMAIAKVSTIGIDRSQLEILTRPVLEGSDFMYALPF